MAKKIGFLFFLFLFPLFASAHAVPVLYYPEEQSVLDEAPEVVSIKFTEHVAEEASSITIYNSRGEKVSVSEARIERANPHIFTVPFEVTVNDTYTVSWQVLSADDGHFTKGAYGFSVGPASTNANITSAPIINYKITFSEFLSTALEIIGQALIVGVLAVLFLLTTSIQKETTLEIQEKIRRVLKRITRWASLLVVAGVALYLYNRTGLLAESSNISNLQAFKTLLLTSPGKLTFMRLILGVGIFVTTFIPREKLAKYSQLILALGLVASRAKVSHSAASHFYPELSVTINFFHLLFKDIWTGGVLVLLPVLALLGWVNRPINIRFAKIVSWALLIGGTTGTFIVWLHLKSFVEIFNNNWGRTFALLSVFAFALVLARSLLIREYVLSFQTLREKLVKKLFIAEAATVAFVLIITSVLIITTPPIHQLKYFSETISSNDNTITLADAGGGQMSVNLKYSEQVKKLTVVAENSSQSIGPVLVSAEQENGAYTFPKSVFSPIGQWKLVITAEQEGKYDARAIFDVNYPKDLEVKRGDEEKREFGLFEVAMILAGLGVVGLFVFWWRNIKKIQ